MADQIAITNTVTLHPEELEWRFVRASGPGGQNVNKVATAAQLRFDLARSPSLPSGMRQRARKLAGNWLTSEGEILITASSHRTQALNRQDALDRLVEMLRRAAIAPKRRIATRPTLASKKRRLEGKTKRSAIKKLRGGKPAME